MGKYIIELKRGETAYKTVDSNGTPLIQLLAPTPYAAPDLEQIRKEAYEQGHKDGKIEGQAETWACVKKIEFTPESVECVDDLVRMGFDVGDGNGWSEAIEELFEKYSAHEAIEKIRQYEQEKEEQIQVGDEVIPRETEYDTMIVTRLWKDDYDSDCIDAIGFDGRISSFLVSRVSKTGKHCEIAEVLQKMKETNNG